VNTGGERHAAELRRRYEQLVGRVANPARLTGGEIGAGSGFSGDETELRVALGFPDTYEIGIANQAMQILYHEAGRTPGVTVERVYLPWVDVIAELRAEGLPLVTLESWTPVRQAHLLGLTLQHELNFSNVLELLDLAEVPLRAAERGEGDPLVLGGGPAMANFLPLTAFFDAFVVGDGELIFPDVLAAEREARSRGASRRDRRDSLARIPGVYVPGISRKVIRRVVSDLALADYPEQCLVPLTAGVHDRAWVEVMRGCTRGCRYCQAGMWYRPVRERPAPMVISMAAGAARATGHEEVSLASLSTTDYSALAPVIAALEKEEPDLRVNLPSLRVDSAAVRLAHVTSERGSSVTLAPEAGSQRMRDVINKNVSEADIVDAVGQAFSLGYTTIKLYFMIGLPEERDEDVEAIVDLVRRLQALGREHLGPRVGRLQVHVSVTNFIPKPFTPFQWAGMAAPEVLKQRQELLRRGLRGKGLKLSLHDIPGSYLEAALARGGEEIAGVIEGAWRRGARFDSWTEQFDMRAWEDAFTAAPEAHVAAAKPASRSGWGEAGSSSAAREASAQARATRALERNETLPWDLIEGAVDRGFLWAEWQRALRAETTADCRGGECGACGACGAGVEMVVGTRAMAPAAATEVPTPQSAAPAASRDGTLATWYSLSFAVDGRARFLGHLDSAEVLRRAVRRAGGRLALSAGLRPKPLLGLALPRAVGVSSRGDLAEFALAEQPGSDFTDRLSAALPEGFRLLELTRAGERPRLAARVEGADYLVGLAQLTDPEAARLREAAERYSTMESIPIERIREKGKRQVDVREYADQPVVQEHEDRRLLSFSVRVTPWGTARPEEVVRALQELAGLQLEISFMERVRIQLREDS